MFLPPEWLVQWTQYLLLLAGTIAAIQTLLEGKRVLRYRANDLKRSLGE